MTFEARLGRRLFRPGSVFCGVKPISNAERLARYRVKLSLWKMIRLQRMGRENR